MSLPRPIRVAIAAYALVLPWPRDMSRKCDGIVCAGRVMEATVYMPPQTIRTRAD